MPLDTLLEEQGIEKIKAFIEKHRTTPLPELLTSEGIFYQAIQELEGSLSETIKKELSNLAKQPISSPTLEIDVNDSKEKIKNKLDQFKEKIQQELPEDKQPKILKGINTIKTKLINRKIDVPVILNQITQINSDLSRLKKTLSDESIRNATDIVLKKKLATHYEIQALTESLPEVTAFARCLELIKLTKDKSIHIHKDQPLPNRTSENNSPITTLTSLLAIQTDYWGTIKLSIKKEKRAVLSWFADIEPELNKQREKSLNSLLLENLENKVNSLHAKKGLPDPSLNQRSAEIEAPKSSADFNQKSEITPLQEEIKRLREQLASLIVENESLHNKAVVLPGPPLQDDPMDKYNDPDRLARLIYQIEETRTQDETLSPLFKEASDYSDSLELATNDQVSLLLLIAEKESEINKLKDTITGLNQAQTSLLDQMASTKGIAGTLKNLLRENKVLEEKLAAENEDSAQLKIQMDHLENQLKKAQATLAASELHLSALSNEKASSNKVLSTLKNEKEALKKALSALEEAFSNHKESTSDQIDGIAAKLETANKQLQEKDETIALREAEIVQQQQTLTQTEEKTHSLNTENIELGNQLQTLSAEAMDFRDTLAKKEAILEKTQATLAASELHLSALSNEKASSNKVLSTLKNEKEALKKALSALEEAFSNHKESTSDQIDGIAAKLETANKQLQEKDETIALREAEIVQQQQTLTQTEEKTHSLNTKNIELGNQVKTLPAEEETPNKYGKLQKPRIISSSTQTSYQGDHFMPQQQIEHEKKIGLYEAITPSLLESKEVSLTLNEAYSSSHVSSSSTSDETEVKSLEIDPTSSEESLSKGTQTTLFTEEELKNNSLTTQEPDDKTSEAIQGIKAFFLEKAQQLIRNSSEAQNLGIDPESLSNEALKDPHHGVLLSDLTRLAHKIYQDNKEDNAVNLQNEVQRTLFEKEEEIQKALEETFARIKELETEKHKTNESLIPNPNQSALLLKLEEVAHGSLAVELGNRGYIASKSTITGLKHRLRTLVQNGELMTAKVNLEQVLINKGATPEQIAALIQDEDILNNRLIHAKADQSKSLIEQVHELAKSAATLETNNHQNKTSQGLKEEWQSTLGFIQNVDIRLQLALHSATSRELLAFTQEEQDYLSYLYSCIQTQDLEQKKWVLSQEVANTSLADNEKNTHQNSIQLIEQICQNKESVHSHSLLLKMLKETLVACIQKNDQASKQAIVRSAGLSHLFKLTQSPRELEEARTELYNKLAAKDKNSNAFAAFKDIVTHEIFLFEPGSTLIEAARITTKKTKEYTFTYKAVKEAHIMEFSIDSINGDIRPTMIKKYANNQDFIRLSTQSMLELAQGSGEKPEEKGMGILILNTNDPGWLQRLAYIKAHQAVFPSQQTPLLLLEGKYTNAVLLEPRFVSRLEKLKNQYIQAYNRVKEQCYQPIEAIQTTPRRNIAP